MTYPQPEVAKELSQHFIPLKFESGKDASVARRLGIRWLPGLAVLDADERPAHTITGYLPPDDLLPELDFARAMIAMTEKRYDDATALFRKVSDTPGAERAAEACYWWGVNRYRQTKDFANSVVDPWKRILKDWPKSQWARKVGYATKYMPA